MKRKLVSLVIVAAFVLLGVAGFSTPALAHHGRAEGACVDNTGKITVYFEDFGTDEPLLGGLVTVTVAGPSGSTTHSIGRSGTSFSRTFAATTNGTYTVTAAWTMDYNRNLQSDEGERFGFTNTVTIAECNETEIEYCTIPGKTHLPKDDPACKEEEKCAVPGKTHLPKNDPGCKEDEKCAVSGKTHLPKNDPGCKEDEKCTVAGKTHLPKNDPNCKSVPQVQGVSTLPSTGTPVQVFAAAGLATLIGYVVSIRRHKRAS